VRLLVILTMIFLFPTPAFCVEGGEPNQNDEKEEKAPEKQSVEATVPMKAGNVRQFHLVLDELLTEFGYDVKNGQVSGLKNVSIRKSRVNETLPQSYEKYLEMLVSERVRQNSDVRLINCITCNSRTSSFVEGKLKITSPETNVTQLRDAAKLMGIENFIDVMLVYHSSHMILAIEIFNIDSGELLWTKTYNSETLRTRFQKLAVDYSQISKAKAGDEYSPEFRYMIGIGAGGVSNVAGESQDNSAVSLQIRASEKFNNRNSEFGIIAGLYMTMASVTKAYPVTGKAKPATGDGTTAESDEIKPKPFKNAISLQAIFAQNFLGSVETYDDIRHGYHLGLGFFYTTGYFAPQFGAGWDVFFGKRFVMTPSFKYLAPSNVLIGNEFVKTTGGASGEVIFSYSF
jgi:hypothetical protein